MKPKKEKIVRNFDTAAATYDLHATVQRKIARRLAVNIAEYVMRLSNSHFLELGAGTGFLTDHLLGYGLRSGVVSDVAPEMVQHLKKKYHDRESLEVMHLDAESFSCDRFFDAAFSSMAFQWIQDLSATFKTINIHLRKKAFFAFSLPVKGTFPELARASSHANVPFPGLDFRTVQEISQLLDLTGFKLLAISEKEYIEEFRTTGTFFTTLKKTGTGSPHATPLLPGQLKKLAMHYHHGAQTETGVRVTYQIMFVCAEKIQSVTA